MRGPRGRDDWSDLRGFCPAPSTPRPASAARRGISLPPPLHFRSRRRARRGIPPRRRRAARRCAGGAGAVPMPSLPAAGMQAGPLPGIVRSGGANTAGRRRGGGGAPARARAAQRHAGSDKSSAGQGTHAGGESIVAVQYGRSSRLEPWQAGRRFAGRMAPLPAAPRSCPRRPVRHGPVCGGRTGLAPRRLRYNPGARPTAGKVFCPDSPSVFFSGDLS